MKKSLLFLLTLAALLSLAACRDDSEKTIALIENAGSDYTAIYPQDCLNESDCALAIAELENSIRTQFDGAIALQSDYLAKGDAPDRFEILIGNTNRPESSSVGSTLREHDYFIGFVGEKLVVIGGSDEATATAIRDLNASFFKKARKSLRLPEAYRKTVKGSYPVESFALFGVTADGIGIRYDAVTERDALALQNGIRQLTGYTLPLSDQEDAFAFTVALTSENREVSQAENVLSLSHSDEAIRRERIDAFLEKLKREGSLTDCLLPTAEKTASFSLLSLNLYATGYGENAPVNRCERLLDLIREKNYPDVLTLQDVSPVWSELLSQSNGAASLTERYGFVGLSTNTSGVQTPILYRKDRLMLIDTGEFRLSAVADYGELTFCRFAVFDCIETGERFAILNTALDRYSEEARTEGMQKLIAYADTLTCPIILAADLESTKIELPFLLATAYRFDNSFLLAEQSDGYEGRTENGAFGSEAALYYKSDFIFTSYGDFHIYSHTVDRRKIDGRYISNHWPLYLEFALKTYP